MESKRRGKSLIVPTLVFHDYQQALNLPLTSSQTELENSLPGQPLSGAHTQLWLWSWLLAAATPCPAPFQVLKAFCPPTGSHHPGESVSGALPSPSIWSAKSCLAEDLCIPHKHTHTHTSTHFKAGPEYTKDYLGHKISRTHPISFPTMRAELRMGGVGTSLLV